MNPFRAFTTLLLLMLLNRPGPTRAQRNPPSSKILSIGETSAIINDAVRKQFGIDFTIVRVYKYVDRSGQYYCVLTEKLDSLTENDKGGYDSLHYKIRAINLKEDSGKFKKVWEINDYAIRDQKFVDVEQSIWFWTRYVEFTDFDDDGIIEPVIVYGSGTEDGEGGRIKFIIYYKGQKVAIRHQDSDLDEGRSTQVDKAYYNLPSKLKVSLTAKMDAMNKARQGIFEKTSF
ncbi:MAG TPA: hypothetical protein VHC96_17595 [Puia sp.]|jgi:hypothetical protein|nr:hypothetical protein [Puia sp.]